jgi:hypothetical protein
MKKSREGGRRKASGQMPEPHVGIFWLLYGKPLIDSIPLSEAEPYGDHLTHPHGHGVVWGKVQQSGIVPADIEYEEPPRGRVIYNTKARRFTLLADRYILRDRGAVRKVMSEMNLPIKNTDEGADSHYRCFVCLRGTSDEGA